MSTEKIAQALSVLARTLRLAPPRWLSPKKNYGGVVEDYDYPETAFALRSRPPYARRGGGQKGRCCHFDDAYKFGSRRGLSNFGQLG